MRVTGIEHFLVHPDTGKNLCFVRVDTDAGHHGWGECYTQSDRDLQVTAHLDQLYFTAVPRFERGDLDRSGRASYYAGAAVWLVGAWVASQTIAIVAGARLPEALGLGIAAPLALAGLLAKSMPDRPASVAAGVAATAAVVGAPLPFHSSTLVAALIGLVAGSSAATRGGNRQEVAA